LSFSLSSDIGGWAVALLILLISSFVYQSNTHIFLHAVFKTLISAPAHSFVLDPSRIIPTSTPIYSWKFNTQTSKQKQMPEPSSRTVGVGTALQKYVSTGGLTRACESVCTRSNFMQTQQHIFGLSKAFNRLIILLPSLGLSGEGY